jgi:DNA-binding NarL/FixJ family response regulator
MQTPVIRKWSDESMVSLNGIVDCQQFTSIQVLLKSLSSKDSACLSSFVVLLDIENELYTEYIKQLYKVSNCIKIIGVGYPKSFGEIRNYFLLGLKAYIDITFSELDLLKAIKSISNNHFYLPDSKVDELIKEFIAFMPAKQKEDLLLEMTSRSTLSKYGLSEKERTVVEYLLKGYSYKQIAEILGLTLFGVNQRTKSVYKKCGVRSRNELSYLLLQ